MLVKNDKSNNDYFDFQSFYIHIPTKASSYFNSLDGKILSTLYLALKMHLPLTQYLMLLDI